MLPVISICLVQTRTYMKLVFPALALVLLSGCVSITPRAARIQVLRGDTTQVQGCKRLGRIDGDALASKLDYDSVNQQAVNNMRDAAASKWGDQADTIVVSNVDQLTTHSIAHGTAFACGDADAT